MDEVYSVLAYGYVDECIPSWLMDMRIRFNYLSFLIISYGNDVYGFEIAVYSYARIVLLAY